MEGAGGDDRITSIEVKKSCIGMRDSLITGGGGAGFERSAILKKEAFKIEVVYKWREY